METISIDNSFLGSICKFDYQSTVLIHINCQTFIYQILNSSKTLNII